ncbi:MAG: NAD-dependent epimerase/dehydratase family protein [Clostridiales bacterium]|nr:NAD-dependent epimerase/dehydratase family protein [Clostridiales bacterium]
MNLYDCDLYKEDIRYVAELPLPWEKLQNKSIVLSGTTGLIGSFFVDVILEKNTSSNLNCVVYALGRNRDKVEKRFGEKYNDSHFHFIQYDVNKAFNENSLGKVEYVLHLASNTHPMQYATDPIGTITTNIVGLQNMLDLAVSHSASRFIFASSNEIYGENRRDVELFDEDYCGYINSNTLRAGYPESKRCGEALCQAYMAQKGLDVVIPRFTRSYGPTMLMTDTKAVSQFIINGILGKDIILKSEGTQYYSYQYMADSVSGMLYIMLCGDSGEAYNIAEEHSDILLRDLASIISSINEKNVVFEVPNDVEASGYSKATKARLNGKKLMNLGWKPKYDIQNGISRTINILKQVNTGI